MKCGSSFQFALEPDTCPFRKSDELNLRHATPSYLRFSSIFLPLHLGIPTGLFSSGFSIKVLYDFFVPHTCHLSARLNFLYLIIRIIWQTFLHKAVDILPFSMCHPFLTLNFQEEIRGLPKIDIKTEYNLIPCLQVHVVECDSNISMQWCAMCCQGSVMLLTNTADIFVSSTRSEWRLYGHEERV